MDFKFIRQKEQIANLKTKYSRMNLVKITINCQSIEFCNYNAVIFFESKNNQDEIIIEGKNLNDSLDKITQFLRNFDNA